MRRALRRVSLCSLLALGAVGLAAEVAAQERIIELTFTPTDRAQMAIWLETADGEFVRTLRLTEAVAFRGIGNRPGALQMNSGFRWPYGRREGVLPVWAHRRASAAGAELFPRVIFQDRLSEGFASRTSNDASPDDYFCLSFNQSTTTRDALDAVTCASQFNSDKGRYITQNDVDNGYAEPWESEGGESTEMRPLDLHSYYPPRRDLEEVRGDDHPDVARFREDSARIMPEIDAVTMATLPGDEERTLQFAAESGWEDGDYVLYLEVNVEGDYNESYDATRYPTPSLGDRWDYWARTYGYPYRGQPSVVYRVPFTLGGAGGTFEVMEADGYGDVQSASEENPMDGTISDSAGSGADRLRIGGSARVSVRVRSTNLCSGEDPPPQCGTTCSGANPCEDGFVCSEGSCVGECDVATGPSRLLEYGVAPHDERSWDQASLRFLAPERLRDLARYEVRVAREPLNGAAFESWGVEAKIADLEDVALVVPTEAGAGELVEVDLGHLTPQTNYFIGIRAVDSCNRPSEVAVAPLTTTEIIFTTVSPCFVATAAYGTPMAEEIGPLRRFRDRHLQSNALGRKLVEGYYELGPLAAQHIRDNENLRAWSRWILDPVVQLTRALVD